MRELKMAKILIIEDQQEICQAYTVALRRAHPDYEVVSAYFGEEGVGAALRDRPDLVILDLELPDIHGLVVAERLKEGGILPEVPLIIASGLEDVIEVVAKALDAAAFLTKPFDLNRLVSAVEGVLAAKYPRELALSASKEN